MALWLSLAWDFEGLGLTAGSATDTLGELGQGTEQPLEFGLK